MENNSLKLLKSMHGFKLGGNFIANQRDIQIYNIQLKEKDYEQQH